MITHHALCISTQQDHLWSIAILPQASFYPCLPHSSNRAASLAGRSKDGTRGRLCFQRKRRGFSALALCFSTRFSESFARPCCCYCSGKGSGESARPLFLASFSSSLSNRGWKARPGLGRRGLPGKARARRPQHKKRQRA
jgi:hypothetical protein